MPDKSNVIPFKRSERGHALAVEKIGDLLEEMRATGTSEQDLLIALALHTANMGIMLGSTRGTVLDVMCMVYDSEALRDE